MSTETPFTVDMAALVDALGKHLYSDPLVAVREMIANCRDSLVRVRNELPHVSPHIGVHLDRPAESVTFTDNGPGMSRDDVVRGLATLAGSTTRVLRAKKDYLSPDSLGFTGRFGLGFFSSLMVSREVRVVTATQDGGPGLLWRCGPESLSRSSYTLEELPEAPRGTSVTLAVKPEFRAQLLDAARLTDLLQRHGDFIEFPIEVDGVQVNRLYGPWEAAPFGQPDEVALERCREYLTRRQLAKDEDLIWLFKASKPRGYRVLFYVTEPATESPGIQLYVQRMFVRATRDLLPEHLGFVRGVALAHDLPLTLGREDLVHGPDREELQRDLRTEVLSALRRLVADEGSRGTLLRLVNAYGRDLKLASLEDPELLDTIGRHLPIRTLSGSDRALGHVAPNAPQPNVLYFVDDPETQASAGALFDAQGTPVFNVSDRLDLMVLTRYASATNRVAKRADTALHDLVTPTSDNRFGVVEALFAEADPQMDPKAVEFKGGCTVPALVVQSRARPLLEMLREASRAGADLGAASLLLDVLDRSGDSERQGLLLNTQHPLILYFLDALFANSANEARGDRRVLVAAARALIASALAYSSHMESTRRATAYQRQTEAYEALLQLVLKRET